MLFCIVKRGTHLRVVHISVNTDEKSVFSEHVANGAALDTRQIDSPLGERHKKRQQTARSMLAYGGKEHRLTVLGEPLLAATDEKKLRKVVLLVGDIFL